MKCNNDKTKLEALLAYPRASECKTKDVLMYCTIA